MKNNLWESRFAQKEILCTLGPASRNPRVIARLTDLGVSLFRINLSHTKAEDLEEIVDSIRAITDVPICLDTEGAQVRTGDLDPKSLYIEENQIVRILNYPITGNAKEFNLYPCDIVNSLRPGDLISIDFNSVLVQVTSIITEGVTVRVLTGGLLGQNKAVTVDRELDMPPITAKDKACIKIGLSQKLQHFALSFANSGEDVDYIRSLLPEDAYLISKIESLSGINNLRAIAGRSNAILLDRGDLSREVPLEQIARAQKHIIRRGKEYGAMVYVDSNLLESMIESSNPTRAEVNDVFNTLVDGADGLVLAAETAIGAHPVNSAVMVSKIMRQFQEFDYGIKFSTQQIRQRNSLFLVEPHGGELVDLVSDVPDWSEIERFPKVEVDLKTIMDAEQIAIGTYSPLTGFMTKEQLESVVSNYRLPDGTIWPLPITLQANRKEALRLSPGDQVALGLNSNGEIYATMKVDDIYEYDLDSLSEKVFGTSNTAHPGVSLLKRQGGYFIGGEVRLYKRLPAEDKHYELTPLQMRKIFANKGWSRVVGFHTRNVAHRVHEFIQKQALEQFHCDGILIHPLVGPKKVGDYHPGIILKSYAMMIRHHYPDGKVLLSAFQSYPRYSGPREAVFTALCRKNFGCTHFIVGRDHSGVGDFYPPDAGHKLFEQLGDIGIQPIYFNEVHYHKDKKDYSQEIEGSEDRLLKISGTEGREMLRQGKCPPDWFMRKDIAKMIIDAMKAGDDVFYHE